MEKNNDQVSNKHIEDDLETLETRKRMLKEKYKIDYRKIIFKLKKLIRRNSMTL